MSHSIVKESSKPFDNTLILVQRKDGSFNIDQDVFRAILNSSNQNQQVSILHVADEDHQSAELVLETFEMAYEDNNKLLMDHDYTPYTSPSQLPYIMTRFRMQENETTGDPKLDELMKTLTSLEDDNDDKDDLIGLAEALKQDSLINQFSYNESSSLAEIVTSTHSSLSNTEINENFLSGKEIPRKEKSSKKLNSQTNNHNKKEKKISSALNDDGAKTLFSTPHIIGKRTSVVASSNVQSTKNRQLNSNEVQSFSANNEKPKKDEHDVRDKDKEIKTEKEQDSIIAEIENLMNDDNSQTDISNLDLDCNTDDLVSEEFINDVAKLVESEDIEAAIQGDCNNSLISEDFLKQIDKSIIADSERTVKPADIDSKLKQKLPINKTSTTISTASTGKSVPERRLSNTKINEIEKIKSVENISTPIRSSDNKHMIKNKIKSNKRTNSKGIRNIGENDQNNETEGDIEEDNEDNEGDDDESWNSEDDPDRLWCICQKPHNNRFMICCDKCEDWFHGKCVNVTQSMGKKWEQSGREWVCPKCIKKQEEVEPHSGKLKKKCLCVYCHEPIENRIAAYCSDKCISAVIEGVDKFVLIDRITSKCLGGAALPSVANLRTWLKDHPNYQLLKKQKTDSDVVQRISQQNALERHRTKFIDIRNLPEVKKLNSNVATVMNAPIVMNVVGGNPATSSNNVHSNSINSKSTTSPVISSMNTSLTTNTNSNLVNRMFNSGISKNVTIINAPEKKLDLKFERKLKERIENPQMATSVSTAFSVQKNDQEHYQKYREKDRDKDREIDREISIKLPQAKISPSDREKLVRESVRKVMKEHLESRLNDSTDLKIDNDELLRLVNEIELELYKVYGSTGQKYRNKYRSLLFNIKDTKNETLWKRICNKKIAPCRLVQLSPDELASQELSSWREKEAKHQLEIIKRSEIEALNTTQHLILKSRRGEELMEVIKPKTAVDIIGIDDGSIDRADIISKKNFKDPITSIINEFGDKRKEKDETSEDRDKHSKRHKSSSNKDRDRDRDKDRDKDKNKDKSKKDYDKKYDRNKDKNYKNIKDKEKDRIKDKEKEKDKDDDKENGKDKDKQQREKPKDNEKWKDDDATEVLQRDELEQFAVKFDDKESYENSIAVERTLDTILNLDDSLLREFDKKQELEEQKKLEEQKAIEVDQRYERLRQIEEINEKEKLLSKQIEQLQREVNERKFKYDESNVNKTPIAVSDSYFPNSTLKRSNLKDPVTSILKVNGPKSILKNTIDDEIALSKKVSFSTSSTSTDYSVSNAKWRALVHISEASDFFVNAVELSAYSMNFETELTKFLQVKGRLNFSIGWNYIEKMKKSQISILKLVAASYEDKSNYLEYFTYLHSRSRLGVFKCETDAIKDFYVFPLAEKCPLPNILKNYVAKKIEDNHPDLLLAVIVRSKKKVSCLSSSFDDVPFTQSDNVQVRVDPRLKKDTILLPSVTHPITIPSTLTSINTVMDSNDDLNEPYSPTDDDVFENVTDCQRIPSPPPPPSLKSQLPIKTITQPFLDTSLTSLPQLTSQLLQYIPSQREQQSIIGLSSSSNVSIQDYNSIRRLPEVKDNTPINPIESGLSILENFEPFSNKFDSIPGLEVSADDECSDESSNKKNETSKMETDIPFLGNINLPTNLHEILQNIKNINVSSTSNTNTNNNYGPSSSKRFKME